MRFISTTLLFTFIVLGKLQSADVSDSFEVASIRPSDPANPGMSFRTTPNGFYARNWTVSSLILDGYDLRLPFQIIGAPAWTNSDLFDIEAKSGDSREPEDSKRTADQRQAYFERLHAKQRALLADRFAFKAHAETREMPVYLLVVAKNGPRLTPVTSEGLMQARMGHIEVHGGGIGMLMGTLQSETGRIVIDRSGLQGYFDYKLDWVPEWTKMAAAGQTSDPGPSLFTALESQLGLRLQSAKGPVKVLVIDHVEKPSAN